MMNAERLTSKLIGGGKYVYLAVLFVLLSGFFYPVITGASFEGVVVGTLVLSLGLVGAILVYKGVTLNERRGVYMGAGFGLLAASLFLILLLTNRFMVVI